MAATSLPGHQLPLGIALRVGADLEGFHAGANAQALRAVEGIASDPGEAFVYLWGPAGVGKSHLLQAACGAAGRASRRAGYLPLAGIGELGPAILEGWEHLDLVCLDDLEAVAGNPDWEQALFHLFNRLRDENHQLLVAARNSPAANGIQLADLASRLTSGLTVRMEPLGDDDLLAALALRAERLGLELPEDTARYLLRRFRRDMRHLCDLLDRLDQASLAAQRRLTVPFVRGVLPDQ
jgi:DnaA family protein